MTDKHQKIDFDSSMNKNCNLIYNDIINVGKAVISYSTGQNIVFIYGKNYKLYFQLDFINTDDSAIIFYDWLNNLLK